MRYEIYERGNGIIAAFNDVERATDYFYKEIKDEPVVEDSSGFPIKNKKVARDTLLSGEDIWAGEDGKWGIWIRAGRS